MILSHLLICIIFDIAHKTIARDLIGVNTHELFMGKSPHLKILPELLVSPKSCPHGVKCVPPIQCPAHLKMANNEHPVVCNLYGEYRGFCCATLQNHTTEFYLKQLKTEKEQKRFIRDIKWSQPVDLDSIRNEANFHFQKLTRSSRELENRQTPFHESFSSSKSVKSDLADQALGIKHAIASRIARESDNISIEEFQLGLSAKILTHTCPASPPCHPKLLALRYRSIDGVCNNPINGAWGSKKTAMERLLVPAYSDGVWGPRIHSVDGSLLSSPRAISFTVFPDIDRPHPIYNLNVMQFGQFLSHEITQSGSILNDDGKPIECCSPGGSSILPTNQRHFACFPIHVPPNDPFYSKFNVKCLNGVRSIIVPNKDCKFGYAKQLNKVTHFIDGSAIYGSDGQKASEMRSFKDGRLIAFHEFNRELLPLTRDAKFCASLRDKNTCFNAGDSRVNQVLSLTAVQTLFLREHNRIAAQLLILNPHWSDEILYQETRRIVVAELQHIVYSEFLPILVGKDAMLRFDIQTRNQDYSTDYDSNVNPAVTAEFVGAAFRFGHSTVDWRFLIQQPNHQFETITLPDAFFNPVRLRQPPFYDQMMQTLYSQPMQSVDESFTKGLSRFLFKGDAPFGLDLASININRGRDWGLRSYNDYLSVIGFKKVDDFSLYGPDVGHHLASVYKHPDDIDLYVGGLLEAARDDSLLGPTFSEIISDQFSRLRKGDRYFYEHGPEINPGSFNPEQLNEIKKVTFARIICDNLDKIAVFSVPPKAFHRADLSGNQPVHCDNPLIPRLDLSFWRE
ncbi:chorion peroxidase [Culicoides brevitarsis]|uniref:chorion peroxidase n=1 Tax=Culicoides brevitarsis TaxID=469753 RepID=UPI00307BAB28